MKLLFTLFGIAAVVGQSKLPPGYTEKVITTTTTASGESVTHTTVTSGGQTNTNQGQNTVIYQQNQNGNGQFGNGNNGNGGNPNVHVAAEEQSNCLKLHASCNAISAANPFAKDQCCKPLHCQVSIFEGIFWPTFTCTDIANQLGLANNG